MKRGYIPFIAFLVLLLLTIPFPVDLATSVIPGWHTTIFPHYFIWGLIVIIVLLLVTAGYWILSKRVGKINWTLFVFHFILTIPIIIFLKFSSIFSEGRQNNQEEIAEAISLRIKLIPVAWTLFIAAQALFITYFVRTIHSKRVLK